MAGIDHQISETFKLTLNAGERYIDSNFPNAERERDTAFIIDSGFLWRFERTTVSANIKRDFSPSIYGEEMTRDRINAALRYLVKENLNCNFTASYYRSETSAYSLVIHIMELKIKLQIARKKEIVFFCK